MSSDKIKVGIKVRPLIHRERAEKCSQHWVPVSDAQVVQVDPATGKPKGEPYTFDHVFGTESTNQEVFETLVQPIVEAAVKGFNGTIFAYGQTASGKTYTMMGDQFEPGIIPQAVNLVFNLINNSHGREFLLRVCYMEIYNEKVHDLLCKTNRNLKVSEDCQGNVFVKDLKEDITSSSQMVMDLMKKGETIRKIGVTNMNERSSRSHSIFRVIIESRAAGSDTDEAIQVSHLNLVDLAGSERAGSTGSVGEQFKEGCAINKSLFTLGKVISQLSEGEVSYVNFRDSKLTRILQSSLGGNALTAIICAITPAAVEETSSTLGFASRARNIRNTAQVNEVLSDGALLKRYVKQIDRLSSALSTLEQEKNAENRDLKNENVLLQERLSRLKDALLVSSSDNIEPADKSQEKFKKLRRRTWSAPNRNVTRLSLGFPIKKKTDSVSRLDDIGEEESRLSFISVDFNDESAFSTPLEEFERALINAERGKSMDGADWLPPVDSFEDKFSKLPEGDAACGPINYIQTRMHRNTVKLKEIDSIAETPPSKLRSRIVDVEKELDEIIEFTRLEKQMFDENLKDENEALKLELQKTKEDLREFRSECESLTGLKEQLENLKITDRNSHDLRVLLLDSSKQIAILNDENKDLRKQVTDVEKLKQDLDSASKELSKNCKDNLHLKERLVKQEEGFAHLQNEKDDFDFQLEIMRSKYENKLKELTQALEDARYELSVQQNPQRRNTCMGDLYSLEEEPTIDELVQQVQCLKEENTELQQKIASKCLLVNELASLETVNGSLVKQLETRTVEAASEIEQLTKKMTEIEKNDTQSYIQELKQLVQEKSTELLDLKKGADSHQSTIESLMKELKTKETVCADTAVIIEQLQEHITVLKSTDHEDEIRNHQNLLESKCAELANLEKEIESLRIDNLKLQEELDSKETISAELALEKDQLKEQIVLLETQHSHLSDHENLLQTKCAELVYLEKEIESLRCGNLSLKEELESKKAISAELADLEKEIESLRCDNLSLKEELESKEAISAKLALEKDQLKEQVVLLETQHSHLSDHENLLQTKCAELVDLEKEIESLRCDNLSLRKELESKKAISAEVALEKDRLKEHVVHLETKCSQLSLQENLPQEKCAEVANLEKEIGSLRCANLKLQEELESKKAISEAVLEISCLKCSNENLADELGNHQADILRSAIEMELMRERIDELENSPALVKSAPIQDVSGFNLSFQEAELPLAKLTDELEINGTDKQRSAVPMGKLRYDVLNFERACTIENPAMPAVSAENINSLQQRILDLEEELGELKKMVCDELGKIVDENLPLSSHHLILYLRNVRTKCSSLENDNKAFEAELKSKNMMIQDIKQELEAVRGKAQDLLKTLMADEVCQKCAALKEELTSAQIAHERLAKLQQEVQNEMTLRESTQAEMIDLQKQCEVLEVELRSARNRLVPEVKAISNNDNIDDLSLPLLISEFVTSVMKAQEHVASVLQSKMENCTSALEASVQRETDDQKLIEQLRDEVNQHIEKNFASNKALEDLKQQVIDHQNLFSKLKKLVDVTQHNVSDEELLSVFENKLLESTRKGDEVDQLQSIVDHYQIEMLKEKAQTKDLRAEIMHKEDMIEKQDKKVRELQQKLQAETKQVAYKELIQSKATSLYNELSEKKEQLAKLEKETSEQRLVLTEKEGKIESLLVVLEENKKEKNILEANLLRAKAERDLAEKNLALQNSLTPSEEIQELKAEAEFFKQQYEDALKSSRDIRMRNRKLQGEMNRLKEEVEESKKSTSGETSEIAILRGLLREEVSRREEVEIQLDELCKLERSKPSRVSDFRKKREAIDSKHSKAEVETLRENLLEKEQKHKTELSSKSQDVINLSKLLKEKEVVIENLEAKLKECQLCKEKSQQILELENEKSELDKECEILLSWGRGYEESNAELIDRLAALLKDLVNTKLKVFKILIEKIQFVANLSNERTSSLDKVTAEQIEMQLSSKEKAASNAKARVEALVAEIEGASSNFDLLEELCSKLHKENEIILNLDEESLCVWNNVCRKESVKSCTECKMLSKWGRDEEAKVIELTNIVSRLEGDLEEAHRLKERFTRSSQKKQCNPSLRQDCQCADLKRLVQTHRTELADKNAEIVELKMKQQVQNKPAEDTIKRLQEKLKICKDEVVSLKAENRRILKNYQETTVCETSRRVSKASAHTQTTESANEIYTSQYWSGAPSGVVEDANRRLLEHKCRKLEQEKDVYKTLCVKRKERIDDLEQQLTKYLKENQENDEPNKSATYFTRSRKNH